MLSAVADDVYGLYNLCALPCTMDFRDKQVVLKLMLGHWAPTSLCHLPGNVISAAVGLVLVYINLQPEYELPSLTRFKQFQKFEKKLSWCTVLPSHPNEIISARGLSSCSW